MIPSHQLLAQRVRAEASELERSVQRAQRAWQAAEHAEADQDMYIDSAALNLHSFYAGLERLFEYAAHQLDGGPPRGDSWRRDLLFQMAAEIPGTRPAIVSSETAIALDEFRRFRHVVRNVYAEHLDPKRIADLIAKLPALWDRLGADLMQFAAFLEGVSRADDELEM
jgi:hypothetical protein